ncbi:hypothetical protein GCM10027294_07080 [Marinactinospora endophytica]
MRLVGLFGRRIVQATAAKAGSLRLVFDNGVRLMVPPGPGYEAWSLVGPRGELLVCFPGGGLGSWGRRCGEGGESAAGPVP